MGAGGTEYTEKPGISEEVTLMAWRLKQDLTEELGGGGALQAGEAEEQRP